MSDRSYEEEPLANLLDYEPELFMGATSSEVGWIVGISLAVWLAIFTMVFAGIAAWLDIWAIFFAAVPVTAIAVLISAIISLKRLQKAKMNKPEGYHIILIRLKMQKALAKVGKAPHFIVHEGSWGIDRYVQK